MLGELPETQDTEQTLQDEGYQCRWTATVN